MKEIKIFLLSCIIILGYQLQVHTLPEYSILQKNRMERNENKIFLQESIKYISDDEKLKNIQSIYSKYSLSLELANQAWDKKKFLESFHLFSQAKNIEFKLYHETAIIFSKKTQFISQELGQKKVHSLLHHPIANSYYQLGIKEFYRGQSYLRLNQNQAAIHVFRRSRSFLFHAFDKIGATIPKKYSNELNDLKTLPLRFQPPQLKKS